VGGPRHVHRGHLSELRAIRESGRPRARDLSGRSCPRPSELAPSSALLADRRRHCSVAPPTHQPFTRRHLARPDSHNARILLLLLSACSSESLAVPVVSLSLQSLLRSRCSPSTHWSRCRDSNYLDDRFFWSGIAWSYSVTLVIAAGVIVGIGLGIARRPTAALLALGSVAPWVAIWCIEALRSDLWNSLAMMCLLFIEVGFALTGRPGIHRSSEAFRSNQAASN